MLAAVLRIVEAQDYTLLLGMPGTGKSSTIVHAVIALLAAGASIVLMSYTNRCAPCALPGVLSSSACQLPLVPTHAILKTMPLLSQLHWSS